MGDVAGGVLPVPPLEVRASVLKLILFLLFEVVMTAVFGIAVVVASGWAHVLVGLLLLLFVALLVFHGGLLLTRRPMLVADERGITDRASLLSAGLLPWHNVTGLTIHSGRNAMLVIDVADRRAALAHVNVLKRPWMRLNARMVASPVTVPLVLLPMDGDTLVREILGRAPIDLSALFGPGALFGAATLSPPAGEAAITDLLRRTAAAGLALPADYVAFLRAHDGYAGRELAVFGTRNDGRRYGVLEATWRSSLADEVVLAEGGGLRYTLHVPTGELRSLANGQPQRSYPTFTAMLLDAVWAGRSDGASPHMLLRGTSPPGSLRP